MTKQFIGFINVEVKNPLETTILEKQSTRHLVLYPVFTMYMVSPVLDFLCAFMSKRVVLKS